MEIYIDLDIELIRNIAAAYLLIGMLWLLVVLRAAMKDQDDFIDISDRLGIFVLVSVLGWPYNLFCWIFSWPGWLMPVSYFIGEIRPSEDGKLLLSISILVLLILNIAHVWLFGVSLN